MAGKLYVLGTEPRTGKSAVILFLMELLKRNINKVSFFRPIIQVEDVTEEEDNTINLVRNHFKLDFVYEEMFGCTTSQASHYLANGQSQALYELIIDKINNLESKSEFILCDGLEFEGSTASFDFDINIDIASNIGSPVLLVSRAKKKSINNILETIKHYHKSLGERKCDLVASVINRVDVDKIEIVKKTISKELLSSKSPIFVVPEDDSLGNPSVGEIASLLNAKILFNGNNTTRSVKTFTVAAMQLRNLIDRIEHGSLVITPGDRSDVMLTCFAAVESRTMPNISGILLTGGLIPEPPIQRIIKGFENSIPVIAVNENTFEAAIRVDKIHAKITPDNHRKINQALAVFERHINDELLSDKIITSTTKVVTPLMFESRILQRAKSIKRHIVLPEGEDERIIRAAEVLLRRDVVDITLLGNAKKIQDIANSLGLNLGRASIINPKDSKKLNTFSEQYYELRKYKGLTPEQAKDAMLDVNYFGTMMVYSSIADGMVSGASHTTADTIRPAFQFIKTDKDFSIVSSVFFMCLEDRVLVYGDCAINPDPTAHQLAEIALNSARTASLFGIEPIVAMLSYSSGKSGKGIHVEKVREATILAKEKSKDLFPGLLIEGPIQYDAAVDPVVANAKLPESEIAGKATVLIFPDLNTGNNTYKAVQRSAGAVAIGPILQGLNKPINDLSRGCTVPDIINTVAITAIQAR